MFWHIDTDIIGLLVIAALYLYTIRMLPDDEYTARNKQFLRCLRIAVPLILIDIAASVVMEVPTTRFLYTLCMMGYLLTQDLMMVMWFVYALTILYDGHEKGQKRLTTASWALYGAYALLVLSNPWTGWFFTLDAQMTYARGPLFLPALIGLYFIFAVMQLILTHVRWNDIPTNYPKAILVLQPIILGLAIPVQLLNPGWLMVFPAYMFCLVLAFLFFQNVRVQNERAQLKQLTEMVEHFACGMVICRISKEGKLTIQYLSSGLATICELSAEELRNRLQQDMLTGVHPDDRTKVETNVTEIGALHNTHEMTYRYITDAGRMKHIHVHAEAMAHADGTTTVYATYTDLTELKKAEQIIDVALANTGVSIWEYDFRRRCIIQYQNSAEMHGFERVVPNVPQSLVESGFVHPDSAAAFLEMYDKLFAGAAFAEGVFRVQTSDRKGYWYEHIRYTNAFDENGIPYRAVGMSTDETQRQEAIEKYERELTKEQGFMAEEGLLVHATFDLTAGTTLDYRYWDGSEVPEHDRTTFSHAKESAVMLIDAEERARFLELNDAGMLLARFAAGETEFRQEYRRTMPDGMVTWVRNTLRLLRDPHSGNVLLFEYWYDIESEKMLELMYRSIATDNYDFVARIDGRTRQFDVLAKAGLTYHMPPQSGSDADEVTHSLYGDCVLPEDREQTIRNSLIENVRRHLKAGGRFSFTYRMVSPDGDIHYKKVTQYYIDPQREIIAVLREDVTELIKEAADKNRVLSEALEAANQASLAKSKFLSRVSHELRTPLNAIIGFMELAKDADMTQTALYLAHSDAAARQLLSVINDVLDVSSIESGKMQIAHAPFDFRRLIRNMTDLYEPQCRKKGLVFETKLLTPVDEWLMGDQLRVNQILHNLLNNALKFTETGHVFLTISQRPHPMLRERVMIRFEVTDTGCGMSEEMRERLFHPFEQESAVTAQKYGGNGLGLSIVNSLVSMMDGTIRVESRRGEGSTFLVELPFIRSETETITGAIDGSEQLHVLVVDDTATEREYISIVLDRIGARHHCVMDAESALSELARAEREGDMYNVCLVDWNMPQMDGLTLARRIRTLYGQEMIVIISSAYDHYQADESAKAAGANMFISKPLFQSALFDLFGTLTNGGIARRRNVPEPADLSRMRILLVEDNAMNRMVAENLICKKFGARCECAQDGQVALDKFLASAEGYYDAILMDIQMPNMDGYEATERIRASTHPDAKYVQIIALTANAFREDVAKTLSSGMNAHVSKPIEPEALGVALAQAYARGRQRYAETFASNDGGEEA